MRSPVIYNMQRGLSGAYRDVAHVVALPNGKCVVSWPTSTIVYDSEDAARAVHIDHMGGRGEPTRFVLLQGSDATFRGWYVCYQDRCEGIPDASGPEPPHYIEAADRDDYEAGYMARAKDMYGEDYKPDLSKWQGAKREDTGELPKDPPPSQPA
jgi:hypothetical protein